MNDILVISLFECVNKVVLSSSARFDNFFFLAKRLELLSSETAILSWIIFSATL